MIFFNQIFSNYQQPRQLQQHFSQRQNLEQPSNNVQSQNHTNSQSHQHKSMRNEIPLPWYSQQNEITKKNNLQILHKYQTQQNHFK